jgi:hypothetical protein
LFHVERRRQNGDDDLAYINEVKSDLEQALLHEANGAQIRARERWAEEGETSSSYFFRQEKCKGVKKLFTAIKNA